jgi:hypothetical protein
MRNALACVDAGGKLDGRVWSELAVSSEPALIEYTISENDVQGPFLKQIPSKMEAMKDLDRLAYTSPLEAFEACVVHGCGVERPCAGHAQAPDRGACECDDPTTMHVPSSINVARNLQRG